MTKEKIIVQRKRRFTESRYSVGIYVDGEFIVNTLKSDRQEIELSAGKHVLKVKQTSRSGEIEIDVKKGKITTCVFTSTPLTYLIYALFIGAIICTNVLPAERAMIFLYISPVLVAAYTYTKGRKAYFIFEETTEDYSWLPENNGSNI